MKKKTNNIIWPTSQQYHEAKFFLGNKTKEDAKMAKKIELIDKLIESEQPELDKEFDKTVEKYDLINKRQIAHEKIQKIMEDHNQIVQFAKDEFAESELFLQRRKRILAKLDLTWKGIDTWLQDSFDDLKTKKVYHEL